MDRNQRLVVAQSLLQAADALETIESAVAALPSEGSLGDDKQTIRQLLEMQVDGEVENRHGEDPDLDEDELRRLAGSGPAFLSDELIRAVDLFDIAAWKALLKNVERLMVEESTAEIIKHAHDLWADDGGYYIYMGSIGHGISIEDHWHKKAQLNLNLLCMRLHDDADVRRTAHDVENEFFNAASAYVSEKVGLVQKKSPPVPVLRGPEHDEVFYKYAGTNDTIAGASARGMYVAKLSYEALRDEGKELGHCIGNPAQGHPQLCKSGEAVMYSIRTESGKTKFTIEQMTDTKRVSEIKGKANRLPGFEPGADDMTKPDDVRLVVEFLLKGLGLTPTQIENTPDIRGGVQALKATGVDPFAPPAKRVRPMKPEQQQRSASLSAKFAVYDFNRSLTTR